MRQRNPCNLIKKAVILFLPNYANQGPHSTFHRRRRGVKTPGRLWVEPFGNQLDIVWLSDYTVDHVGCILEAHQPPSSPKVPQQLLRIHREVRSNAALIGNKEINVHTFRPFTVFVKEKSGQDNYQKVIKRYL